MTSISSGSISINASDFIGEQPGIFDILGRKIYDLKKEVVSFLDNSLNTSITKMGDDIRTVLENNLDLSTQEMTNKIKNQYDSILGMTDAEARKTQEQLDNFYTDIQTISMASIQLDKKVENISISAITLDNKLEEAMAIIDAQSKALRKNEETINDLNGKIGHYENMLISSAKWLGLSIVFVFVLIKLFGYAYKEYLNYARRK